MATETSFITKYLPLLDKDYSSSERNVFGKTITNGQFWWTIIIIFNILFVIIMSIALATTQVSGCGAYDSLKSTRDTLQGKIDELVKANSVCQSTVEDFNKSLKILQNQVYFSATGTPGSSTITSQSTQGFVNNIVSGFEGFSSFSGLQNYDTVFNFTGNGYLSNINIDNFSNIFSTQSSELLKAKNLPSLIKSNITSETEKTSGLKNVNTQAQSKVDDLQNQINFVTKLLQYNTDLLNNPTNQNTVLSNLKSQLNDLNSQKTNLNQQLSILNNQKVTQDNLVVSLEATNQSLLNKIKTQKIDCTLYK